MPLIMHVKKGEHMLNVCNFGDRTQGILLTLSGSILLLHTLGVLDKYLSYIIIAGSIYMIVIGLIKIEAVQQVMALLNKQNNQSNNNQSNNQQNNNQPRR